MFMDSVEAGVALVDGFHLRMSLNTAEARCGIVRRVSLTQVRLVLLTQYSQLSGFWKALMYASSVAFFTLLAILGWGHGLGNMLLEIKSLALIFDADGLHFVRPAMGCSGGKSQVFLSIVPAAGKIACLCPSGVTPRFEYFRVGGSPLCIGGFSICCLFSRPELYHSVSGWRRCIIEKRL